MSYWTGNGRLLFILASVNCYFDYIPHSKNPIISSSQYLKLQKEYARIPGYKISDIEVKIPAGWLIERAGFKGKRYGEFGVHDKQALVLVNYGNASGKEIYQLAQKIRETIIKKFEITLEIEVNIIK